MTTSREYNQSMSRFVPLAVACASLVALGAAPAAGISSSSQQRVSADHRVVHRDARRDVVSLDLQTEVQTADPRNRSTDITRTLVDHRSDGVILQARVRALSRTGYRLLVAEIVASDGRRYELDVDYSSKPIGPRLSLLRHSGKDVSCPGATWGIDRSVSQVRAYLPNSCLSDPAWVRVGVGMVGSTRDLKKSWADDSRAVGGVGKNQPALGPRQHTAA